MTLVQIRGLTRSAPGSTSLPPSGSPPQTRRSSSTALSSPGAPLIDADQRKISYIRLSLTDRCNYRCTYCRPPEGLQFGARDEVLNFDEIVLLMQAFAQRGVKRVRLTGGEPTLRQDLPVLIARLKEISGPLDRPLEVVMTTNGDRLAGMARSLFSAGLDGLTVSIDSLQAERFATITRGAKVEKVFAGLLAAKEAGFRKIKLNAVAVAGFNDDEIADMAKFAWEQGHVPRFIELMPMSGGALFVPGRMMAAQDIRDRIAQAFGASLHAEAAPSVAGLGPARYWRLEGGPQAGHQFGVIAAMTENFCDSCNRLRVSATGRIHACLANDDAHDLRAALRQGDLSRVETVVAQSLRTKRPRHLFELDGKGGPSKAMISIGG